MSNLYKAIFFLALFFSLGCSAKKKTSEGDSKNDLASSYITSNDSIIGVITLGDSFQEDDTISILNADGSLWYKFSYKYDDKDGVYDFYNESFRPLAFHPDNYSLALKAVSKEGSVYQVIVNEETGLKKFINVNGTKGLVFKTFSEYIVSSFAVSFDPKENPLKESIGGNNVSLPQSNNFIVRPLEIKGDWLKVKHEDLEIRKTNVGWIKWRDGNRIIIQTHTD